jgi:hypothetical protein
VGLHMTRQARRLRGALRPMTRQYTGGNSPTISKARGGSVPIVSQTEIDPMKTALSRMFGARHDDGAHRAAARAEVGRTGRPPHGYIASGSFCMPSTGAADAIAKPSNGTCPWGWITWGHSYRACSNGAGPSEATCGSTSALVQTMLPLVSTPATWLASRPM